MEFENNDVQDSSFNDTEIVETDEVKETGEDVETVDENSTEGDKEVVEPLKQTSKQDKAFAEMRRKLEAAEKEAQQLRELNSRAANLFKEHGVKNINEYFDKLETQLYEDKKAQLEEKGLDEETIDSILKAEKEKLDLKRENETLKQTQYAATLTSAYKEIQAAYPDLIKSPEDISDEVWAKFDKGYSMIDAFESVNKQAIREMEQAKVKQKTINNINSKKHLKVESDGASDGSTTVMPDDVLQGYIDMGFSKKDAIAHYKKLYG